MASRRDVFLKSMAPVLIATWRKPLPMATLTFRSKSRRARQRARGVEMTSERTRSLMLSKYYCTERALEVKAELIRLETEGTELKTELDATADPMRQGAIRRRRAYLKRRTDELKSERAVLTAELKLAADGLKSTTSAGWNNDAEEG